MAILLESLSSSTNEFKMSGHLTSDQRGVYLNNAATSFPKPKSVICAVHSALSRVMHEPGRVPGREDPLLSCRKALATLFGVADPNQIALLPSATFALNTVITGLLEEGGHAISTILEHNSVLRPLEHMSRFRDVSLSFVAPGNDGCLSAEEIRRHIRAETQLIVVSGASNVTGAIQPIEELADIAAKASIPLLVDAAQSAGVVSYNYQNLPGHVFLAFAGHKGLLGPAGTGGLIVPDATLKQMVVGGTGIRSESLLHPEALPLRHEAGTPNLPGIAGLEAGALYILEKGIDALSEHRHELVGAIRSGLQEIPGIRLSKLAHDDGRAGIVSFVSSSMPPDELGFTLFEAFGITLRTGLHCAPRIHESLETSPLGTVRISVGPFNTMSDVRYLVHSLKKVCLS